MRKTLLAVIIVSLVGCVSSPDPKLLQFPKFSDTSYVAADGRTWVAHEARRIGERFYVLEFIPQGAESNRTTEILRFEYHSNLPSIDQLKEISEDVKKMHDPAFTYEITPSPSGYIMRYHSPDRHASGVSKTVFREDGGAQISYTSRLITDPEKRLEFWTHYISSLPNQALQPTPTAGTSAAKQP